VLATTKDHAHRIYLSDGIYGEVTLRWRKHQWEAWPWTYPDYDAPTYHAFFSTVRSRLKDELIEHVARKPDSDSGIYSSPDHE